MSCEYVTNVLHMRTVVNVLRLRTNVRICNMWTSYCEVLVRCLRAIHICNTCSLHGHFFRERLL